MIDENGPTPASEAAEADVAGDDDLVSDLISERGDAVLESDLLPPSGFAGMNLDPDIQEALADMGYLAPMEVQTAVFQDVMEGRDIMVQSRTGSGKTAAFGIPIAQKLDPQISGAQVLCLAPTRELALQVAEELKRITRKRSLAVVPIYGGAPMKPQIDALTAGAQIIAGTPGRVLDHIRRKTLKTGGIRFLVLDECDEMLSMGFQEEIENILQTLPPREERQTMLFSATIPEAIERIGRRHMRDPHKISLSHDGIGVREISHYYYMVSGLARTRDLLKVLKAEKPESAIIFCNTREDTATVAKYLARHGYDAEAISSDLTQKDRERVMKRTRDKNLQFMVATDIAARGIDISDLSHVINYQFPESPEVYVHRTGRTGRAGKAGVALSLVGPREIGAFYYLKLIYKIRPQERDLPSAEELLTMQEGEQYERVVQLVTEKPTAQYLSLARRLWQSVEGERVVGALLQRLLGSQEMGLGVAPAPAQPRPARVREPEVETGEGVAAEGGGEPRAESTEEPRRREERGGRDRDRGRGGDRDRGRVRSEGRGGRERERGGRERERGGRERDRGERGGRERGGRER
jgi:ATP-dependent RNA helicase DeaD